ncbi:MAG: LysM peptidoglycan-binding domain-containing protein [Chloroflexota bacterium]|nr:MAG: LysM peptidoglycan-binding domain-containing protein [Chloroflexota bacterium]
MVVGHRHWKLLLLPLLIVFSLTACERPLASNEDDTVAADATATAEAETAENEGSIKDEDETEADGPAGGDEEVEGETAEEETQQESVSEEAKSSDPDVGVGTPETAAADADQSEETDLAEEADETGDSASGEMTGESADSETTADTTAEEEAAEAATAEEASAEDTMAEDEVQTAAETTSTLPATHTVAPGENLYRIGLKYGMSWVTLAAYNNLPNPNYIRVGQVLYIPGGGQPTPAPPIAPPDTPSYVDYVVQPGDTLYSIGQKFGVSWVEIAEANGIVNPNLIYAGQVLKIPTSQPETPPAVTHTVRQGETLYRISLQYGVHWLAIAQANQIAPPYVIYPGQVLVIPSG